jgi:putative flippase GtrA
MIWFNQNLRWQIVRFAIVGVICTAIHYLIYVFILGIIGTNPAYIVGYLVSFASNFYLTAFFTFKTVPSWRRLFGMAGAHGVNFMLHLILLNVFLSMGIAHTIAPIPVFAIAIPINFLLVRFVFNNKKYSAHDEVIE